MAESPFDWLRVGHWTDGDARTGVTVLRFDQPTVASGEVRGGAPATREFALLEPTRTVARIDALVLAGGSAFGLAAADGVVSGLEQAGVGFETRFGRVPIVVGMALYDLGVGDATVRPQRQHGADALERASATFETGAIGAGAGATVGKWRGPEMARPAGVGWAALHHDELVMCALVVVNAAGDLVNEPEGRSTVDELRTGSFAWPEAPSPLAENTTIGAIITNGRFDKTQCRVVSEAGHDGLARSIVPAHSPSDGDALVCVTDGSVDAELAPARLLAAAAVEAAIRSTR